MIIEMPIDLSPEDLAKQLKREAKGDDFLVDFIAALDSELYHLVSDFVKNNPDESKECTRCKRFTVGHAEAYNQPKRCEHCKAVMP